VSSIDISIEEARERLKHVIRTQSLKFGDFTLRSGAKSHYYLDLRKTSTHPEGAFLSALLFLDKLSALEIDAVGGPTLGADPILGAIAAVSHLKGTPLPTFIIRKKVKDHGTGAAIEGHLQSGWRAVVLDDVVTKAGSIIHGISEARRAGGQVDRAMCIVDRDEGGRQALLEAGVELDPIFHVSEILDGAER